VNETWRVVQSLDTLSSVLVVEWLVIGAVAVT